MFIEAFDIVALNGNYYETKFYFEIKWKIEHCNWFLIYFIFLLMDVYNIYYTLKNKDFIIKFT